MNKFLFFIFFLLPSFAFSQFSDDFFDGDFTTFPSWEGDVEKFSINEFGQLQLNAGKDASPACLAITLEQLLNRSWEYWLKMDFNPTSSNYTKIYLSSDNLNLEQSESSLYIRIGHTKKNICLMSQSDETVRTLLSGVEKRVDKPSVTMKIRAELSKNGDLNLYSQLDGESEYIKEGSCRLNNIPQPRYTGISCIYTSTRKNHFFFDDIVVKVFRDEDETKPGGEGTGMEEVTITPDITAGSYQINYRFLHAGNRCRVLIFDQSGRLIDTPYNNELLNDQGILYWNGEIESGQSLHRGIYIIFMEVWQSDGRVLKYKLPVILK